MCIPDDLHLVNESLEQLEDLIEVYNKLSLGQSAAQVDKAAGKKKIKPNPKAKGAEDPKVEALKVLFDLLVSMLTKPQSFLREMANYVFGQFCEELDPETLSNLIQIVSSPLEDANKVGMGEASQSEEESDSDDIDSAAE